jgi:hypothetical protein
MADSENDMIADLTRQLLGAVEVATQEHGKVLIEEIFANMSAEPRTAREKRERDRSEHELARTLRGLTKQLVDAIERCTRGLEKELLAQKRRERSASAEDKATPSLVGGAKPRRHRKPVRPAPPPLDPEQIKRDAENARLRALLKPVAAVPAPEPVTPAPVVVPREPVRPSTPGDVLRALEKEIQDAVPKLGTLGPERCAAQIAVWTGQIRLLRDSLPPDVSATMRPAFRIFIEHLAQLRVAMEAQVVDALEPTFIAPDWEAYIEANRARVEQRAPRLPDDKLQVYHRTMLRALIQPHRRTANQEVLGIMEAARRALPPNDPQLQSALRRFASVWKAAHPPVEASPAAHKPQAAEPAAPAAESPAPQSSSSPPEAQDEAQDETEDEDDFESTWTK